RLLLPRLPGGEDSPGSDTPGKVQRSCGDGGAWPELERRDTGAHMTRHAKTSLFPLSLFAAASSGACASDSGDDNMDGTSAIGAGSSSSTDGAGTSSATDAMGTGTGAPSGSDTSGAATS